MILDECKFCGNEVNIELKDAWVCPRCNALHQTTLRNEIIDGVHVGEIEVTNEMNGRMITIKFPVIDDII